MEYKNLFLLFIITFNVSSISSIISEPMKDIIYLQEKVLNSDAEKTFRKIDFSVKCMFVSNFTLYDIYGLTKNELNAGDGKGYYSKSFFYSESPEVNYTVEILFNFCDDLKKDVCDYEKKQIFAKIDNKCTPIANSINKGNSWYTGESYDGEPGQFLKIELNKEDTHNVNYIIKCNPDIKYNLIESKSKFYRRPDGKIDLTLFIESSEACPKMDFYIVWEFVLDFAWLFSSLLIILGLFNCILGQYFSKYTCFILSLLTVTILVLFFGQYILPSGCAYWVIWILFAVGVILGCTLGYFTFKYHEKFISFVVGGLCGFLLGEFFFSLFGNKIPWEPLVVHILFIIACIIALIIVAFFLKKAIVIFATSFIGSYCFIRGISLFAGGYPSEFTIIDLKSKDETEQIDELFTWRVYVYLAFIVICTVLSIIAQFKLAKFKKRREEHSEISDVDDNFIYSNDKDKKNKK